MLNYLRDAATKDAGQSAAPEANPQEGGPAENYVTPAAQEKNVKQGTMLLVVLFAVGLGCLWLMVKKAGPSAASAMVAQEDQAIERAIAQVTGTKTEFFKGIGDVVSKFNEFSSVKQVKVHELQKNPFEHVDMVRFGSAAQNEEQQAGYKERMEREGLQMTARGLLLQGIMKSPQGNCCMINDKIVYKGDSVNKWKIESITDTSVELSAEGMRSVLSIGGTDEDVQNKK